MGLWQHHPGDLGLKEAARISLDPSYMNTLYNLPQAVLPEMLPRETRLWDTLRHTNLRQGPDTGSDRLVALPLRDMCLKVDDEAK